MKRKEYRELKKNRKEKKEEKQIEKVEKKEYKPRNKYAINKGNILKILALIIGFIAVIVMSYLFILQDNQLKIEGTAVQYYAGQAFYIEDGSTLVRGLDETTLNTGSVSTTMSSIAIYQEEENKIILTQDMIYYDPRNSYFEKIDALTEIYITDQGITAVNGNKEVALNKGFIYDGDDYYIFLEDISVYFNGYLLELTTMSYIEATFQAHVMTFDYDTKTTMLETPETEVTVTAGNGDYTLSLINDSMVNYEEEKTLLFTRPDLLDSIF